MTERDVHFGFRLMGKEVVVSRNPFFISFLCCGSEAVKCTMIKILLNRLKHISIIAVLESILHSIESVYCFISALLFEKLTATGSPPLVRFLIVRISN